MLLLVMDEARRLRRRAAQVRFEVSIASPAPQRRRRCGSSITRRSACALTRSSRQARWRVSTLAAGIVAASMARRCQDKLKNTGACICPNPRAATSEGRWGTLPGEVKEGIGPQGQGGTRARKSPPPSPAQTRPARNDALLRPSRQATTPQTKIQRTEARRSNCAEVPRLRDKVPSRPSVPSTKAICSVKRNRVPSGSPMNSTVTSETEWCLPLKCMS